MKNLIDNYITIILYTILIYTIASFTIVEMQICTARHLHNEIIDILQSSYFHVSDNEINEKINDYFPTWEMKSTAINSTLDRQSRLVALHYEVVFPVFGIKKEGVIEGYAK